MPSLKEIINEEIQNILNEAVKINFKGQQFVLKVDVNEDPNKKGIKVQFLPTSFGNLTRTEQDDIAIALSERVLKDSDVCENDITIRLDAKKLDQETFGYIQQLSQIIDQHGEVGTFDLGPLRITIDSLEEYQDSLIFI